MEILELDPELTGVVARIRGRKSADAGCENTTRITEVGLRADIDAIAQTETWDSPYRSQNPGVMHALEESL